MKSVATKRFWHCFHALPAEVQRQAEATYRLWREDPRHRSLGFKRLHARRPVFSVRIGLHWRALAVQDGDTVVWMWIGSHAEYDRLVAGFR
jgi:hypothetical protein